MVLNALASITKGKNIDKKAKQKIFFSEQEVHRTAQYFFEYNQKCCLCFIMNSQSIKNYINVFQSIVILLSRSSSLFCFDYFLTSRFYFPDQVHYEGITLVIILRASKLHINTWSITYKNVNFKKMKQKEKKRNKKTSKQKQKKIFIMLQKPLHHVIFTLPPQYVKSD